MKLKNLILPLAGILMAGCHHHQSADIDPVTEPETYTEDDYCYFKIQLNFPSYESVGSRTDDSFDYGLVSENAIKNAILLVFRHEQFIFQKAIEIELDDFENDPSNSTVTTVKILKNATSEEDSLWAIIIANNNGLFHITANNGVEFNGVEIAPGDNLDDIKEEWAITTANQFTRNGILMVNTLGLNSAVGQTIKLDNYFTPTPIYYDRLFHSVEEAQSSEPGLNVWLERAVAKVCVVDNVSADAQVSGDGTVKTDLTYDVVGWKLINQNNSSYVFRQWQNVNGGTDNWGLYKSNSTVANTYRFVYDSGIDYGALVYNFTQFSKSYGYDTGLTNAYQPTSFGNCGRENPAYCYENTFPVENMMMKNATCALVKTQFKKEGVAMDIYRVGQDFNNYYTESEIKEYLCQKLANQYTVSDLFPDKAGTLSCEALSFDSNIENGHTLISAITFKLTKADSTTETLNWTTARNVSEMADLNDIYDVFLYDQGYAYYVVPIKHFGDALTPWNNRESPKPTYGKDMESAYHVTSSAETSNNNYLGRYGVVRNNSYVISIGSVKHLGLASDCSIESDDAKNPYIGSDETPLDYLELAMKTEVSILYWGNHEESVALEVK